MRISNSLTKKIDKVDNKEKYNIYMCGPTVYDLLHIGNMRPFIIADTLIRYFRFKKKKINFIVNITDIDDKIIQKAIDNNTTEKNISDKYSKAFIDNFNSLNLIKPTKFLKISDFVKEQVSFISKMIDKGNAYNNNGEVFFDINSLKSEYGKLSNKKIEDLITNIRVEENKNKKNQLDFILWKKTERGIKFESPWSLGRPGWHTECATLNDLYFNSELIDFHFGGIDLKFPHHENERIQYIAVNDKEIAKIWIHNGHLNFDNNKMSKSLKNTILVNDFIEEYNSDTLKMIFFKTNYLNPINLNSLLIEESFKDFEKIKTIYNKISYYRVITKLNKSKEEINYLDLVLSNLENDLNLPNCLTVIQIIIKKINKDIILGTLSMDLIKQFDDICNSLLGFNLTYFDFSENDKQLIFDFEKYKKDKNYKKSDILREKLKSKNII